MYAKTLCTIASAAALLGRPVSAQGGSLPMADDVSIQPAASDGSMAKGGNLPFSYTVQNTDKDQMRWVCWREGSITSSDVKTHAPLINDVIPAGATHTYSAQPSIIGVCAPVYANTQQSVIGGIVNSMFVFSGAGHLFYVDKSSLASGDKMSAKSAQGCTSDADNCSYVCSNPPQCTGKDKMTQCSGPGAINMPAEMNVGCLWNSGKVAVTVANTHQSS